LLASSASLGSQEEGCEKTEDSCSRKTEANRSRDSNEATDLQSRAGIDKTIERGESRCVAEYMVGVAKASHLAWCTP
jgi:hypothetical protein